jgi:hypothetical protein
MRGLMNTVDVDLGTDGTTIVMQLALGVTSRGWSIRLAACAGT